MGFGRLLFLGAITFALWLSGQVIRAVYPAEKPGKLTLSRLERIFAALLIVILLTSWLGLVLAELAVFSLPTLSICLLAVDLVVVIVCRLKRISLTLRSPVKLDHYEFLALAVFALLSVFYAHPGEWIAGGADPGSYINIGVHIANEGAILIQDGGLAAVPPAQREVLLNQSISSPARDGDRFPAFYIKDLDEPVITPQFFHVFPVWIAILDELGGLRAALYTTPFFGLLACFAVYAVGRRLVHPAVGLVAMVLLGLNISQLWFARNPFADIVLQFFLFSGFWSMALLGDDLESDKPPALFAALLAGTCFGIGHLVKLDVFIIPPVVGGLLGFLWLTNRWRRAYGAILLPYLLLSVHAAVHADFFASPYVYDVFSYFSEYTSALPYIVVGVLPTLGLVIWQRLRIAQLVTRLLRQRRWLEGVFICGILLLSLYAYYVRPFQAGLGAMSDQEIASRGQVFESLRFLAAEPQMVHLPEEVRSYVEEGIVRVGWYISPMGIWLGIVGFLSWTKSRLSFSSSTFLGASLVSALMFFYRGAIVSYFYWAFKRYIPVVVPSFMLFIAFLLWQLWDVGNRKPSIRILPVVLGIVLLISYAQGSTMVWRHVEYEGSVEDIASVAKILPANGISLFKRSDESNRLGVPLTYIFSRDVFPIADRYQEDTRLRDLVSQWLSDEIPVHWITPTCEPLKGYNPQRLRRRFPILWPEVPYTLDKLPDHIGAFSSEICVYEILGTDMTRTMPDNLQVEFENGIALIGYELSPDHIRPGEDIYLTLYWQALSPVGADYKVFVHLIDGEAQIVGQKDHTPVEGTRRTSSWAVGETIEDQVLVPVAREATADTCVLQVGLYDARSMQRLRITSTEEEPDDRVILDNVEIYTTQSH